MKCQYKIRLDHLIVLANIAAFLYLGQWGSKMR